MTGCFFQIQLSAVWRRLFVFFILLFTLSLPCTSFADNTKTLREIIQQAILDNPEVQEKWFAFQAATEEHRRSKSGYKPRLDLSSRLGKEWLNTDATSSEFEPVEASLQLSQMLYDGFATRSEVRKYGYARLVGFYELYDTSENVALEASRAYLDVLKYRHLLDLAEGNYQQHRIIFEQVRQRVEAGISRGVDLDQATGRLALANSNRVTELTNLHDVTARYLRIVGALPPTGMEEADTTFNGLLPQTLDLAFEQAFKSNPAFLAALENVRVADADLEQRKAAYQPNLELRARHERGYDRASISGQSDASVVELVLNYNLFRGGADSATISQFTHQTGLAQRQLVRACRTVRQTLDIGYNDVQQLNKQLVLLEQHQTSISNARNAYRDQFDIGQRTLLDLLDTENEFFQARRAFLTASYDHQLAQARTLAAQGELLTRLQIRQADLPDMNSFDPSRSEINPDAICPPLAATTPQLINEPVVLLPNALPIIAPTPVPQPKAVDLVLKKRLNISFDYKDTAISPEYNQALKDMADFLQQYPQTVITINGHTDNIGSAGYNRKLSQARAEAVRNQLVNDYAANPAQIFITWFGFSKPKSDNSTPEGRADNRRTEILAALLEDDLNLADTSRPALINDAQNIIFNFPYRGTEITEEHTPLLLAMADFLKQHEDVIVTLDGQTDSVGGSAYNQQLSRARAEVVRNRLIDEYGTDPDQIFITWSSYQHAEKDEKGKEAAAASRRTVVRFSRIVDNLARLKDPVSQP